MFAKMIVPAGRNAVGQIRICSSDVNAIYVERAGIERRILGHFRDKRGADVKHLSKDIGFAFRTRRSVCDERESRPVGKDRLRCRVVVTADDIARAAVVNDNVAANTTAPTNL
jgi:hypothetical protein